MLAHRVHRTQIANPPMKISAVCHAVIGARTPSCTSGSSVMEFLSYSYWIEADRLTYLALVLVRAKRGSNAYGGAQG